MRTISQYKIKDPKGTHKQKVGFCALQKFTMTSRVVKIKNKNVPLRSEKPLMF